jgi:hypothetical protein
LPNFFFAESEYSKAKIKVDRCEMTNQKKKQRQGQMQVLRLRSG